ncbi:uncharacterized protein BDZ83DRAFT_598634 [Colletotrichum acutatum]|uniref:Uncharacterized protein n=1 Tax=Glomerella acutata TaxID=27357 RepID=A0AAD9D336_GLOAC|nr:uncharacterized protein BDZ83DRAFT_598634 [Colletotrichum acutatum]KAK1731275.1 hypothetical protein BDZ83DRAFT_598634 [Colletotrichum acutatum]
MMVADLVPDASALSSPALFLAISVFSLALAKARSEAMFLFVFCCSKKVDSFIFIFGQRGTVLSGEPKCRAIEPEIQPNR